MAHRSFFADHCSKNCKLTYCDIKEMTGCVGFKGSEVSDYKRAREIFGGSTIVIIPTVVTVSWVHGAAAAKSLQSCATLCDPIDGSPPGSAVPGILQARTLEWVAIAFSIV